MHLGTDLFFFLLYVLYIIFIYFDVQEIYIYISKCTLLYRCEYVSGFIKVYWTVTVTQFWVVKLCGKCFGTQCGNVFAPPLNCDTRVIL